VREQLCVSEASSAFHVPNFVDLNVREFYLFIYLTVILKDKFLKRRDIIQLF
jgi:hypothetical protein